MFNREEYEKRIQWFRHDRFGMFIHWGLYAIPARGEWIRNYERITTEDYQQYFDEFDPVDYDPVAWARIAKKAGMKYAVMTAKHHDGFCLFDSKLTDYKATNTKAGRDLIAEYVKAFRDEGLKVGLYYSLLDWHHEDYPHFGDRHHPQRSDERFRNKNHQFDRYLDYMHGQVKELCTNYGKLDLLWFDFSYDELRGDAWRGKELVHMVRSLQPNILMDNRLEVSGEGFGSLLTDNPTECSGDFVSPEQIIPPKGIVDCHGRSVMWEACITMNRNWGYCADDHFFKPADMIVRKLVECVSKDGNLLLNIGPDARGKIPKASKQILGEIGEWMQANGKSIYGCGMAGLDKPETGRLTRNGKRIYYHVTEAPVGYLWLEGLQRDEIQSIRLLADGSEMPVQVDWISSNYPDKVFVSFGSSPLLPDPIDTVIEVLLK